MSCLVQGSGEGLRGPHQVAPGGTLSIDIGPNDTTVEVSSSGGGTIYTYAVVPGKQADIPAPPVPEGTILIVTVGRGARRRKHIVEVVAPAP